MKKILFVDDDALVARIYSKKLREAGFDVMVAEDGVTASKQVTEYQPDLVVLDLLMPRLSGADVLKYIREHPTLNKTRVVVFSNSFLAALVEQVGALGVEAAVAKSKATPGRLIETIKRVLEGPEHQPAPVAPGGEEPTWGVRKAAPAGKARPKRPGPRSGAKDQQARERIQQEFEEHTPAMIAGIREGCRELLEVRERTVEAGRLEGLTRKTGFLSQAAAIAGRYRLAQLASALEALFFHLYEKGAPINYSCRNTIASAVALLAEHMGGEAPSETAEPSPASVLVVDDDAVSGRMVAQTLACANLHVTNMTDPAEALATLGQTRFDLVVLDVMLPGMDGITLCEKMRASPLNRRTPVLFLTSFTDARTRSRSILSGGEEFIPKPILPLELNVKVFAQLLKHASQP
jgi:CheY-like chemotaxis protein